MEKTYTAANVARDNIKGEKDAQPQMQSATDVGKKVNTKHNAFLKIEPQSQQVWMQPSWM